MKNGFFRIDYNSDRYHESIGNVTPANVNFSRDASIIESRRKAKKLTIENRRLNANLDELNPPLDYMLIRVC